MQLLLKTYVCVCYGSFLSRTANALFNPSIPELIDVGQTLIADGLFNPRFTFTNKNSKIFVVEPSSNYFYFELNERDDGKAPWQCH